MRERAGLTLAELASRSGYSIGTINGLELRGEGSQRLKDKLAQILTPLPTFKESVNEGRAESVTSPVALRDDAPEYHTVAECKQRITALEKEVAELRIAVRVQAREISSAHTAEDAALLDDAEKPDAPSGPAKP